MKLRFAALLGALFAVAAQAATYTWTGAVSTDFADAGNWLVGGVVPATPPANNDGDAGDTVILPATVTGNQPVLSANWNLRELRFDGSGWTFATGAYTNKVGRYGNGVVCTYGSGSSTFSGNLQLGSIDPTGPGWDIADGGTLRINGTIGRYAQTSGNGAIRKRGGGTLELNTGTSLLNALRVEDGLVVNVAGAGGLDSSAANRGLTINGGTYDMNGNQLRVGSFNCADPGRLLNGSTTPVSFTANYTGNGMLGGVLSGPFSATFTHNGTPRVLTFTNAANDYSGATFLVSGITAILRASSSLAGPGVFGTSTVPVTIGTSGSGGGGTVGRVSAILADGAHEIGKSVTIGTDVGRHQLGSIPAATGVSTFSGNVMVGLGALYNGDNPHLEVLAGTNAWVEFTGNITNALEKTGNYALRDGRITMFGPGIARLSGDNTYKGGTIVSNGTLIASSATALGTAGATVAGGALLVGEGVTLPNTVTIAAAGGGIGGRGTIAQDFAIGAGVSLRPGDLTGTFNVPSQTWTSGGTYQWQVGTAGSDALDCDGTLTFSATPAAPFTVTVGSIDALGQPAPLDGFDGRTSQKWTIATAASVSGFDPAAITLDTTAFAAQNTLEDGTYFEVAQNGTNIELRFRGVDLGTVVIVR